MLKAIIGMIKWKMMLRRLKNAEPYTDEWWEAMEKGLAFVPEEMRATMIIGIVMTALAI